MNSVTHSILLRVNSVPQAVLGHFNTASALKKLRGNWEGAWGGVVDSKQASNHQGPFRGDTSARMKMGWG